MRLRRRPVICALATAAVVVTGLTIGPGGSAGAVQVAQTSLVVENPADTTPQVLDGSVDAVVQLGSRIFLGGTFSSAQNAGDTTTTFPRAGLLAFDAATGRIDTGFAPVLDGAVEALETDGSAVFAGGTFTRVNGVPTPRLAKLSVSGALLGGFAAPASGEVTDLVVRGARLYVGGYFTAIGSPPVARGGLAAVDGSSGAVLPELNLPVSGLNNGGATGVVKLDVTPDGRTLVLVGNFTAVAGRPRPQMAMVDLPATGAATVSAWATNRYPNICNAIYDSYLRNLDISPDGRYVVVSTTGSYRAGSLCDTTARWEIGPRTPSAQPSWVDSTGGDTTYGVAVAGGAVYVGGHQRWENNPYGDNVAAAGAVPRDGLAALDPLTGLPLTWDPGRARGVGAQALYTTASGLWVGSDTAAIGRPREQHGRIAFFPLAGGTPFPVVARVTWPAGAYQVTGATLTRRPMSSAGMPTGPAVAVASAVDWTGVRGGFLVGGTLFYGRPDGRLYARTADGTTGTVGPERAVDLHDGADGSRIPFDVARLTGATFDPASDRLYYVLAGDNALYYRYFSPQSEVVGAQQLVAPSPGVDLRGAAGLALVSGRMYYGSTVDGALRSVLFANAAVAGRPGVVSADGSWTATGLFVG